MTTSSHAGSELLTIARGIAVEAGELARARRAQGVQVAASKSSIEDIVTFADRETESLIRSRIADARPNDGFVGEESGAATGTSGLTWIVDPIDGTVNYLYGLPHYAVSIAVVEGEPEPASWQALAGVVVNPAIGEVFTAADGAGAFLGDRQIHPASPVDLSQALVGTGFGYNAETRTDQARVLAGLVSRIRDVRRMGTASLDLCAVACGRLDGYFERGLKPWDHAAGALIAREAGATVSLQGGAPDSRDLVFAAAPTIADHLQRMLRELGA
ncbi:MAG: inositol monophosphatase [Microbacteriaceae bacterium]|jgi:myo-inositol-1(or 4)-monophosphatase|nr:inositol monophosphatase [Microbacteriaceae bacterium]